MRGSGLNGDREVVIMACHERKGCPVDRCGLPDIFFCWFWGFLCFTGVLGCDRI